MLNGFLLELTGGMFNFTIQIITYVSLTQSKFHIHLIPTGIFYSL